MEIETNIIYQKTLEVLKKLEENSKYGDTPFGDFIFNLVKEFHDNGIISNLKPKENEWTVISNLVMQNKDEFRIIAVATGTKSLPNKNYNKSNYKIFDCHAEILVMRAFKMFIIKCLMYRLLKLNGNLENCSNDLLSKEEYKNFEMWDSFFDIFNINTKTKIGLKDEVLFHLYISESPCGDCSLFPVKLEENFELNQIGSKLVQNVVNYYNDYTENKLVHSIEIGQFRTKSMRNDIKKENISYSLSCSDKLLFKNILGIQGKHLSHILEPIYLTSIVISQNFAADDSDKKILDAHCKNSIQRGISLFSRLNYFQDTKLNFTTDRYNIKKNGFYFNEPHVVLTSSNLIKNVVNHLETNSMSFSSYWYYSKSNFSKIDPVTGFKQGTNINSLKNLSLEKCSVDLCKIIVFQSFINLINLYSLDSNKIVLNQKFNKLIKKINFFVLSKEEKSVKLEDLRIYLLNQKYKNMKQILFNIFQLDNFNKIKNTLCMN